MTEHCLIVGAGQAGLRVALGLWTAGYAGRVTLVGDESRLPYERPPLSKEVLAADADPETGRLTTLQQLHEAGVEWLPGEAAVRLDAKQRQVDFASGRRIRFDRLVIATGARARRPDLPGSNRSGVHCLRSAEDAVALRRDLRPGARVVLIGGGFIGLEVAASAVQRGCQVTVLEAETRLLSRVASEAVSRTVLSLHEARGVDVRLGAAVESIVGQTQGLRVQLAGASLSADVVVLGVGAAPNCDWLQGSGLMLQGGVVVDECCRSSVADVLAVGDVACGHNLFLGGRVRIESWHNAETQAAIAVQTLCGIEAANDSVPWFWTDQYDMNLQLLGLPSSHALRITRSAAAGNGFVELAIEDGVLTGAALINQGRWRRSLTASIATRLRPDPAGLADPSCDLRELLTPRPSDALATPAV